MPSPRQSVHFWAARFSSSERSDPCTTAISAGRSSFSLKEQQNGKHFSRNEVLICLLPRFCFGFGDDRSSLAGGGTSGTRETVIQKATEQFEGSPLKTASLGQGVFIFSGDGGNITAVADEGGTLLIDSGVDSRVTELSDAIFKATKRPVTRLVNTRWHFDHTGGNLYFGSVGVTIVAQENVKKRLSSVQDVPFTGLRDGRYPPQALPAVTYSSSMTLHQGAQQLTLVNYGPAHTDGDTVIYIAPANVAVVGDIFSNHFYPIIDLNTAS